MIQIEYKKIRKASVSCCFLLKKTKKAANGYSASLKGSSFFKNIIRIERARVRGSNKDGRCVCLANSWRWLRTQLIGLSWAGGNI